MKRLVLSLCALTAPLLLGCEQKNATPTTRTEETYTGGADGASTYGDTTSGGSSASLSSMEGVNPAYYTPPPGGSTGSSSGASYSSPPSYTPSDSGAYASGSSSADETLAPDSGQTYVVKKGDTLVQISQRYYGTKSKWKTIWEANQTRIPNPDRIKVGTKLIIP